MKRSFLLLQGVCSPFFAVLARRLLADGHAVHKLQFNVGDSAYWIGSHASSFRGKPEDLVGHLDRIYKKYGITDQILFGDRRPVHRPAVAHGNALGIRTHVFEEGYFRPYWVTLEREGVNGHSLLPRDPDWFLMAGENLPDYGGGERFRNSFSARALHDVAYHAAGILNPILFPRYTTHASITAPLEYAGFIKRLPMEKYYYRFRDRRRIEELLASQQPFFALPLQLNSDAQIRDHSRFENMSEVIEYVMHSFAQHAHASARLVIKNHPLDPGLTNHARTIARLCEQFDLPNRVVYLETGNLDTLLHHAQGMVTVNSTAGAHALSLSCPTVTLSDPIYNLPGLTFQGTLDEFWLNPQKPDPELFRRFRNTVIHTTQINGGFYSREGIQKAVHNSVRILEAERSPLEELL